MMPFNGVMRRGDVFLTRLASSRGRVLEAGIVSKPITNEVLRWRVYSRRYAP